MYPSGGETSIQGGNNCQREGPDFSAEKREGQLPEPQILEMQKKMLEQDWQNQAAALAMLEIEKKMAAHYLKVQVGTEGAGLPAAEGTV